MKIKNLSSNNIQRICEYINSLASVFEKYNPSSTYYIDDYVIYDDKLYKCISNIDSPEEFDNSKWEMILEGKAGKDAPSISKLYCKDNNLYVDFDNKTTKKIENFNFNIDTVGTSDMEDTPVGQIISYMGTKAPAHYLVCDGSIYNIADYQKLADFINDQFGSYSYFGGDGTTTFAVPDLRNEFIRGYHGDSTDTLSGDIGKHQDATTIPKFMVNSTGNNFYVQSSPTDRDFLFPTNIDKNIIEENATKLQYVNTSLTTTDANNTAYTTRPTNVAVLFCIKYENTYYAKITNINTRKETVLYDGFASSGDIKLSDSVKNYDYIDIYGCINGSPKNKKGGHSAVIRIKVDEIDTFREYCSSGDECAYGITYFLSNVWYWHIMFKCFINDTTLSIKESYTTSGWLSCGVYKIIGIKYNSISNSDIDLTKTYTDEEVNTEIDNVLNSYDGATDNAVYTDNEVDNAVTSIINKY